MKILITGLLLLNALTVSAQVDCSDVNRIKVASSDLSTLNQPYFKSESYYTRGGKYDPSGDLIYFMALNYLMEKSLDWDKYAAMEKIITNVPGENTFMAPSIEILRPYMWEYLKGLDSSIEISPEIELLAYDLVEKIKIPFVEITVSSRNSYYVLESETQKIEWTKPGEKYIVRAVGCTDNYQLNMSDYRKFENFANESKYIEDLVRQDDVIEFLGFISNELSENAELKTDIIEFLKKY